jgi:hypothetical protein
MRIRTGATLAALGGGALRSTAAAVCAGGDSGLDLFEMATTAMGEKPGKRQDSGASQDTFYKDDPSIREEVLDSKLGGSVPRVLRFFLSGFFGIFLPRLQMDPQPEPATQPKARGLLHMECDFAIALPYQLRLQDNTGIFEDLRGQHSRTLGTTREDFKIAQISTGVHSSLGMLRLLLRTFDL